MLFSEPKIPQSVSETYNNDPVRPFQCSSASRKFLNIQAGVETQLRLAVSVLFSEPKIPQLPVSIRERRCGWRFSALQRAENSSIPPPAACSPARRRRFQCSSASRKFLNHPPPLERRAERRFQCSSASRKFLNLRRAALCRTSETVSVLFSEPKIPQSTLVRFRQ